MTWVAVEVDVVDMVVVVEVAVVVMEEDMEVAREDMAHKVDMVEAVVAMVVDMVARVLVDMVEAVVAMEEAVAGMEVDMVARAQEDMAALDLKDPGVPVVVVVKTSAPVMARAIQVDQRGDKVVMDSDLLRMVVVQEATAAEVAVAAIKQCSRPSPTNTLCRREGEFTSGVSKRSTNRFTRNE